MKAIIRPSACKGTIKIPPSKSMAHRAIICASLADGKSHLSNIDYSIDIQTTIDCMRKLGAKIECFKDSLIIEGISDFTHLQDHHIECNESGSTLRFLIPIFSLTHEKILFTGKNRLLKRPQKIYEEIFTDIGAHFDQNDERIEIQGALTSGEYTLQGNVSSQFISGLLFTLPLLEKDSRIHILPPFESKSYIDLTIQMMKKFNVQIQWEDDLTLFIQGNQKYQPKDVIIEGDFSQFAFFGVLAAINSELEITGMDPASLQGDKQILDILQDFHACVEKKENSYHIKPSTLIASDIDLKNCPDLGPILCILAMFSKGMTHIKNASRLRLKESDRIEAMISECAKMGCLIEASEDEMIIHGTYHKPALPLSGWKDHRIVMACAVALTILGGEIEGCEAVSKSYPTFFEDLRSIGIEVSIHDEG